jgi:predicted transcriptional regulator
MDLNEKQKEILKILENGEELATTKIAFLISANLYQTEAYLEDLEKEGLILNFKKNNATKWKKK